MTNKEKLWKKIVRMYKAEAKTRYEIGDRIYTPYNSGDGYRIHRGTVYRVHFEEASEYGSSWLSVTASDSKTDVVAELFGGFGSLNYTAYWDSPIYSEKVTKRDWVMSKELAEEFKKFLALGEVGFKPERKPY